MSIIPEIILQRVLISGFKALRKDPRLLDTLFRNLTQIQLDTVKSFILDTNIPLFINYPRETFKVPAMILLLKSENEEVPFLGDNMDSLITPDPDLTYDTLDGHGASISGSSGLPRKLAGPLSITEATDSSLTFSEDASTIVESLLENPVGCAFLYVVRGAGAGKTYVVRRITSYSLDIDGVFDPPLDDTSLVDLRVPNDPEMALGEPSRVYNAEGKYKRKGAQYSTTYHLEIVAGGQDEVIYLYSVVKALLISQRALLESQGLIALKISGSDFAPRSDYLPNEVFQRQMVLSFTYPFSFIEELEVPSKFVLNISADDARTGEIGDYIFGFEVEL